jgi:hypothetical protein
VAKSELRFGVSDGAGKRGATWKLSVGKAAPDVYLACRALQGTLKISLHASGEWRIAYLERAHKKLVDGLPGDRGRVIREWPRPREFAFGSTLAFRIITPWSVITSDIDPKQDKSVRWITKAARGKAIEIDIIITKTQQPSGWPGQRSMGTALLGSLPLSSGETVWVVSWEVPMPDYAAMGPIPMGQFFKGVSWRDLRRGQMLRGLFFGDAQDGSRVVHDMAILYKPSAKLIRFWLRDLVASVRRVLIRPNGH